MNRNTAIANVGMNHLRSLGLSAGRKNARICQRMTGEHATTDAQKDSLKRVANASKGVVYMPCWNPSGRNSEIGANRMTESVGVAI